MKKTFYTKISYAVLICLLIAGSFNAQLQAQCYQTLGSAPNILSSWTVRTNQIVVNNDLNTVLFIHRNNASVYGGDIGNFKYDLSTDNGATWQTDQGDLNPGSTQGVNGGRYPQAVIYNPSGNTSLSNATLVYHGATTTGGGWNGYVSGSLLMDGSSAPTEHYNQAGAFNTNIPGGLCQSVPGTFWTLDAISPDGYSYTGLRILKGTYSSGDVSWAINTELSPSFNTDIYGYGLIANWNMAFDPTGTYGWLVMLTQLGSSSDHYYRPVFYKTVDGGNTWTGPEQLELTSFSNITALEPTPGCDVEVGLTVDMNGHPHALVGVFRAAPPYYIWLSPAGHLIDFTYDGTAWNAIKVSTVSYHQMPINGMSGTSDKIRPMVCRSDDGSKIVFTWTESDQPWYSGSITPNLKAVTYDVSTGTLSCPVTYSIKCPSILNNQMYQTTVSPTMIEEGGIYTVPVVLTILNSSGDGNDPAQFYYLNDLTYTSSQFSATNNPTNPTLTVGSLNYCNGSVELTASPSSSYLWSTGETTQSITAIYTGNYWVVNPDDNYCVGTSNSASVSVYSSPSPWIQSNGLNYVCAGGSLVLNAIYYTQGSDLLWSTGETTPSITVTTPGTYSFIVDGCQSTPIVVDGSTNTYRPTITAWPSTTACYPDPVLLTANENSSYLWSTGETTQSIWSYYGGNYWVVNPDSNNCVDNSNSIYVTMNSGTYIYTSGTTNLCNGESVTLYIFNWSGGPVLWSNGETTDAITVTTAGSYSMTLDGCASYNTIDVHVYTSTYRPTITASPSTSVCYPNGVLLTANQNSSYLWNTGETTQSIWAYYGGNFWVINPDSNYCVDLSNTITVDVIYPPFIYPQGATTQCSGGSLQLYAYVWNAAPITWSNGQTGEYITVTTSGTYTASANGCTSSPVTVTFNAPVNDNICNAQTLTVGTLTHFDNTCATTEVGEPVPPSVQVNGTYDEASQNGWAPDDWSNNIVQINHTLWFSFIAPNTGAVNISSGFDASPYDTQLALYKSSDYTCHGTLTLISANDDGGNMYSSLINKAYCLQKGKRYFIQLDGYGETQGTGTIKVTPVPNTVTICHYPISGTPVTITISGCALNDHLLHGDKIGGCTIVKIAASNEEDITSLTLDVYPNPTNDIINVSFTSDTEDNYTIKLKDILGREILSENKTAIIGENLESLSLQTVTPGVYMLIINKGDNILQTKIVKEE